MKGVTPIKIFRMVASEFSGVSSTTVGLWLKLTEPLVSKKRFGKLWAQALALLTAHRMKMAGVGVNAADDPLAEIGGVSIGGLMRVANYSEGETSIGFNGNVTQYADTDAELALTSYGIQYLNLRRMRIMPIVSAGESGGRI